MHVILLPHECKGPKRHWTNAALSLVIWNILN